MAIEPGGVTPEPLEPVRGTRPDPRVVLWRDSATLLVGVVLALLVWQTFAPKNTGSPTDSGEIPSGITVGSLPPGMSLPPGVTFDPNVVPPSLDIHATGTLPPAITMGPSPSPSPSPSPTPKPSKSPGASIRPSGSPPPITPPPDTPPPDTPPPDTPPPPVANFTWTEGLLCAVDFTNTSSNDTSWDWDFGDSSSSSASSPSHTYASTGTYSVKLTINGGADSVTKSVDVLGPCL